MNLRSFTIKQRLLIVMIIAAAGLIVLTMMAAYTVKKSITRENRIQTKTVVETAYGVLEFYAARADEGSMTDEAAKAAAIAAVRHLRFDETNYFWINDMRPVMVMHPFKPELEGKDLSENKDPNGKKLFVEFVQVVKTDGHGFVDYDWPKPGQEKPASKVSYVKGFSRWGWIIGAGIYNDHIAHQVNRTLAKFTGVISLLIGLIMLLSWRINQSIMKPLQALTRDINLIAGGQLSIALDKGGNDELSVMAENMEYMTENLSRIVLRINGTVSSLASSSEELAATVEDLNNGASELSGETEQVVTAMTEVSQTIMDVAKNAATASDIARNSAGTATKGKQIVDTTVAEMRGIAGTVQAAATTIDELGKSSAQIGEIVTVINSIADQTNLLALNAAIEAARAGEQGRGFAVVADEVRKLAERTAQATRDIAQRIAAIQTTSGDSVEAMRRGNEEVEKGVKTAQDAGVSLNSIVDASNSTTDMIQRIAAATEEQSTAMDEVSRNMNHISDITRRSVSATAQIKQASTGLARLAMELKEETAWFKLNGSSTTG